MYFTDSTIKPGSNLFLPDFQETLSESLMEKLNSLSFAEERALCAVIIKRDEKGSLGLQITEGSDGNVYIQSVIPGGPAHATGNIQRGDQVVAVDGESLLGVKYNQALNLLKDRGNKVEFILARTTPKSFQKSRTKPLVPEAPTDLHIGNLHDFLDITKQLNQLSSVTQIPSNKTCDSPIEKHLTENCHDVSNFHKYGLSAQYQIDVPYHKHIRYEIEPEQKSSLSKKHFILHKNLSQNNALNKSMSKSCCHLYSEDRDKAVVVEMIPKENVDLSNFHSLDRKYLKVWKEIDKEPPDTIPPIALPRSLGLSRKWRGPVRYPVTPIKKTEDNDADSYTYISTSDEEQVFI